MKIENKSEKYRKIYLGRSRLRRPKRDDNNFKEN